MLKILGRKSSSNVQKVLFCVEELGIPYEREDVGGEFGKNNEAPYLALNPNGVVPTIQDDGLTLWESNVICRYLCAKHSAGKLWPTDPAKRADIERWMDWQQTSLAPPMGVLFRRYIRKPPEPVTDQDVEAAKPKAARLWAMLDRHLAGKHYIAGAELSMADFALSNAIHRWSSLPYERPNYANVKSYYDRLCARPAYAKTVLGKS